MLSVNPSVHLERNVLSEGVEINRLVKAFQKGWKEGCRDAMGRLLEQVQEAHLASVLAGESELVCTRCGQAHSGEGTLLKRGYRKRKLVTEEGVIRFRLRQVTCVCKRTWSPYPDLLGLSSRQRVLEGVEEKLIGLVTQLSYARTCALAKEWLGIPISPCTLHKRVQRKSEEVEITPDPDASVVMADGTKIPAGPRAQGEDLRMSFQVVEHFEENGRPRARLRLGGLGIGNGSWSQALPRHLNSKVVVTDAEAALRAYVRDNLPEARHQLCEWHVVYTLEWSLIEDKVKVKRRRNWQRLLTRILFDRRSAARKRVRYRRLMRRIGRESRTAYRQLQLAADLILYEEPSAERTTSLAERQMRELNRRIENGSRWSERGALNLARLRLVQKHNPDDYARLWSRS